MFARSQEVGKRLFLIGVLLGLTATVFAVEPARIGAVKFQRDAKIEKITFDYEGTLRYREYQFPRAHYGYLDFEMAAVKESKVNLKPRGALIKEIKLAPQGESSRQRVRLSYDLERWVAPGLHDTGNRLEISFAVSPVGQPAAGSSSSGAADESASGSSSKDAIFGDYLKLDTQKPFESSADARTPVVASGNARSDTVAAPIPLAPFVPEGRASKFKTVAAAVQADDSNPAPVATTRAEGGEGSPPAAEPVTPPLTPVSPGTPEPTPTVPKAKYEVIKSSAYVPESSQGIGAGSKITGGRGFEFVDLSAPLFQKPVSLTFKDADLQNVIRILARHAELNVVLDPNQVKGRVTLELNNVAVGPALASILRTNDLEIVCEAGSIYRVVPSRLVRRTPQREEVTVHIPLNWIGAEDAKKILDPVVEGDIGVDSLGNAIIVTDTPLKIEEIANVITKIDRPEKQVMLEARLVEMDVGLSRSLGINWDLARVDRDVSAGALNQPRMVPGTATNPVPTVVGYNPITGAPITVNQPLNVTNPLTASNPFSFDQRTYGGMDSLRVLQGLNLANGAKLAFGKEVSIFGQAFQLSSLLQAAEDANLAKVLAAPKIVTVNNQPATIQIQRQIPYTTSFLGAGGAQTVTWSFEPVGIKMTITPNITNNDYVRMKIKPEQKILAGFPGGTGTRPMIDERISETNVIVKDEDTAIIAGLRQQEFTDSGSGVPWLQHIPVLGWLFKSNTTTSVKTDLMAFVTPHIIKEAQNITENERQRYNEIDVQWDLPDYFFDDVKLDLKK